MAQDDSCLCQSLVARLDLYGNTSCQRLYQIAFQLCNLQEPVIIPRFLEMGQHNHTCQDRVIIGDVCILELYTVLELHFETSSESLGVNIHPLCVDLIEDQLGFFQRNLGFSLFCPVAYVEFLANPFTSSIVMYLGIFMMNSFELQIYEIETNRSIVHVPGNPF